MEETDRGRCVCVYSLLDILDLHAGCTAAAGAHEGLRPQFRDLCTPSLNTQRHTSISDPAGAHKNVSATDQSIILRFGFASQQQSNSQQAFNFK